MSEQLGTARVGLSARAVWVLWLAVGVALTFTVVVAQLMAVQPPLPGRPGADLLTGQLSLFGSLLGRAAGVLTLGLLAAVIAFTPAADDDSLPAEADTLSRWTVRAGQVWWAASLFMTFANPTFVTGVPLQDAFRPEAWWAFIAATPSALAWLVSAAVALGIVVVGYRGRTTAGYVLAWLAGVAATVFVAVSGNVSVGLDHDWATDAMGTATLAAAVLASGAVGVVAACLASGSDHASALRRYHRVALPAILLAAAGYAVAAWQQLASVAPSEVAYGLPVVVGGCVLAALALNWAWRQWGGRALTSAAVVPDLGALAVGLACLAAVEHLPPPRFGIAQTIQVNYLGYEVDLPATIERLAGPGRPNLLWVVLAVTALGLYGWGVVRVRRQGRRWPVDRIVFWVLGWGLTLYLATSGLWMYSTAVFSWHMLVHMTVNMMVPLLCVLGAPFGLVAEASRDRSSGELSGASDLLAQLREHRLVRVVLSAPLVWVAYVFSLFVVYFSPLFPWLMRYHWGHQLMLLHFMATGFAFFSLVVAPEHDGRQLPYLVRFALLVSVMPFHAIFAVGIMNAHTVLGEQFYASIAVPWVGDLLADQNTAGQITWFAGEIPAFIAVIMLAAQWFRSDTSEAAAADRLVDSGENEDELAAYNDLLAQLAERDRREPGR